MIRNVEYGHNNEGDDAMKKSFFVVLIVVKDNFNFFFFFFLLQTDAVRLTFDCSCLMIFLKCNPM